MRPLTVTEVNRIIKYKLKEIDGFRNAVVVGEISNFNERSRYGHWYFSLKDKDSQLSCNMFMNYQKGVKFEPANGMKVICSGYVDVYERGGSYQLYVMSMNTVGAGDDMLALEQLKKQLTAEGIFDVSHKKKPPEYPRKIGIVTSASGAAVADLKSNIARRWGLSEIVLAPALVQGDKAPADIVKSIAILDAMPEVDVIIVGRGGGAHEDLKAFNTEIVARAVYHCQTPIISAVGHEVDHTLCDAAADVKVPTPSTAAEVVVHDKNEELRMLEDRYSSLLSALRMEVEREEHHLARLSILSNRNLFYEKLERHITDTDHQMRQRIFDLVNERENRLRRTADKLNALSPLAVLGRGYSITKKDGAVLHSAEALRVQDKIVITLSNGSVNAEVTEVKNNA